jgi:hypothetical protein
MDKKFERKSYTISNEEGKYNGCLILFQHLPNGFGEEQIYNFFSQFVTVIGVRLHRNYTVNQYIF